MLIINNVNYSPVRLAISHDNVVVYSVSPLMRHVLLSYYPCLAHLYSQGTKWVSYKYMLQQCMLSNRTSVNISSVFMGLSVLVQ